MTRKYMVIDDIYFDDESDPKSVLRCRNSEIEDNFVRGDDRIVGFCSHEFYSKTINAIVEAFYYRRNLPDWKKIEERVETLFKSYVVRDLNEREK